MQLMSCSWLYYTAGDWKASKPTEKHWLPNWPSELFYKLYLDQPHSSHFLQHLTSKNDSSFYVLRTFAQLLIISGYL